MSVIVLLLLACHFQGTWPQYWYNRLGDVHSVPWGEWRQVNIKEINYLMRDMIKDVMDDGQDRVSSTYKIRQDNMRSAAYEIGFLCQSIREKYRQMINIYESSMVQPFSPILSIDPNSELLQECSWNLKLRLLKDVEPSTSTSNGSIAGSLVNDIDETLAAVNMDEMISSHVDNYHITTSRPHGYSTLPHMHYLHPGTYGRRRSVGLQHLRRGEPDEALLIDENEGIDKMEEKLKADENNMRLKLFRLMYETVRDSDLKVKRAELIKDHYVNSTAFEIGYLLGDITDKNNIIQDIADTLRKFYKDWKPIEHINAYEQIANQAIEITHLVDLVKIVVKRNRTE